MIEHGYKLTARDRGSWWLDVNEVGRVQYRIDDTWSVYQLGCGALTVFDSMKSVRDFLQAAYDLDTIIWECDYIACGQPSHRRLFTPTHQSMDHCIPAGTIFADAVRLIRPVPFPTDEVQG